MGSRVKCVFIINAIITSYLFARASAVSGKFWQITDVHFDHSYETKDVAVSCPKVSADERGKFGDYRCDSPTTLVSSSLSAMKRIQPDPDFILWTGDASPHVQLNRGGLNERNVIDNMIQVTNLIRKTFPNTPVLLALGNHDYYPKNQHPAVPNEVYRQLADKWRYSLLSDPAAQLSFNKGGYYAKKVRDGLKVINLNTNLYYDGNEATAGNPNPAGQTSWLENELAQAKRNGEKVYIHSHESPGRWEKNPSKHWLTKGHNKRMLNIIRKYSRQIEGIFSGHYHSDSFRVIYNNETAVASILIAPALTPWKIPGTLIGPASNNPAIRLFEYDTATFGLRNYEQYYLDLGEANQKNTPAWYIEYSATEAYGLPDVSAASMGILADKFREKDSEDFKRYLMYNSVKYEGDNKPCNSRCKKSHVCTITELNLDKFQACMDKPLYTAGSFKIFNQNGVISVVILSFIAQFL